jgi:hypothetical protein
MVRAKLLNHARDPVDECYAIYRQQHLFSELPLPFESAVAFG